MVDFYPQVIEEVVSKCVSSPEVKFPIGKKERLKSTIFPEAGRILSILIKTQMRLELTAVPMARTHQALLLSFVFSWNQSGLRYNFEFG